MNKQTKKTLINSATWIWGAIAFLVWLSDYDLSGLGLSDKWIELIQFGTAGLLLFLQAIKPKKEDDAQDNVNQTRNGGGGTPPIGGGGGTIPPKP